MLGVSFKNIYVCEMNLGLGLQSIWVEVSVATGSLCFILPNGLGKKKKYLLWSYAFNVVEYFGFHSSFEWKKNMLKIIQILQLDYFVWNSYFSDTLIYVISFWNGTSLAEGLIKKKMKSHCKLSLMFCNNRIYRLVTKSQP